MTTKNKTGEQLLAEDAEKSKALAVATGAITTEQLEMNQLLGRIQATQAIGSMLEALSLSQLQSIKAQKTYRQLQGQTKVINGTTYDLGTWEGFCRGIGSTMVSINEKLQSLQLLGETALENAQNLGMTTRELRKLRQLNPDDQQLVISEISVAVGDKEAIVELIEDMSVKHAKDKEALQAKINEEKANHEATTRLSIERKKEIDKLNDEVIRWGVADPMKKALVFAQMISEIEEGVGAEIGKLEKIFAEIEQANNADRLPERLRINQGSALVAIKQWCDNLIDRYALGDISETDDGLDWVAEAKKAIESDDVPDYVKSGVVG